MDTIMVNIYGYKNELLESGCAGHNGSSCSSCRLSSGCKNCRSKENPKYTAEGLCKSVKNFLKTTDVSKNVEVNFVELNDKRIKSNEKMRVKEVIDRGFYPPIVVIDGIIRYYGGISNMLIYKDVKELLT
ncbi:hypothetical protein H2684_02285 [Clostridium sp. cel8]|uniref:hypothetical protein n=1 Tax=Clostridium sp. cel8 TaxID=2663123 RepID=UPI0015F4AF83|nr:hypothetical protein [Clostridium sp. cel8]MBA5850145.1 hypothetical protein [Clostridium sp. cel8]